MGLFGITIGKKATAKKQAYKLDKLKIKQDARTDRVDIRQAATVLKADAKYEANEIAYANGLTPVESPSAGLQIASMLGSGIKSMAGFMGGGALGGPLADPGAYPGFSTNPIVNNSPYPSYGTGDGMGTGVYDQPGGMLSNIPPAVLIGGGILLFMMLNKKK